MDKTNLANYYSALLMYKKLLVDGDISQQEYDKIEYHFANKHCIKIDSIIRTNNLINSSFRANYIVVNGI